MAGIEKLKDAVKFLVDIVESGIDKFKDGIQVEDAGFVVDLLPIIELIKARQEIGAEIVDLDEGETAELVDYLKEEFNIDNDVAEEFVEAVVDFLYSGYSVVQKGKALFAPPEEEEPVE
jgi:hypothetical protein